MRNNRPTMRDRRQHMTRLVVYFAVCLAQSSAVSQSRRAAQTLADSAKPTSLAQLSTSLQEIARKVEPAVVQIFDSSLAVERGGETVVLQQRNSGSGILITADGYIVTNAHVVEGSRRLQVRLNVSGPKTGG